MERHHSRGAPALALLSFFLAAPAFAGGSTATSFVQATIIASDPARATVTYIDASGRQHTKRATGDAAASLARLRPGDDAIVALAQSADGPVVTRVRLSERTEPVPVAATAESAVVSPVSAPTTPAVAAGDALPPLPATTYVPMRRSWPNPFAKPRPRTTGQ
jgi:hypothetical protein